MFVLRAQYVPNTCLVCIEYVFGLNCGTSVYIGVYGMYSMYSYVFACIWMYFVFKLMYITLYLRVLHVLVCIACMCL